MSQYHMDDGPYGTQTDQQTHEPEQNFSLEIYQTIMRKLLMEHKFQEAFQFITDNEESFSKSGGKTRPEIHGGKVYLLLMLNRMEDAVLEAEWNVKNYPHEIRAHNILCAVYLRSHRFQKMLEYLDKTEKMTHKRDYELLAWNIFFRFVVYLVLDDHDKLLKEGQKIHPLYREYTQSPEVCADTTKNFAYIMQLLSHSAKAYFQDENKYQVDLSPPPLPKQDKETGEVEIEIRLKLCAISEDGEIIDSFTVFDL